MKYANKLTDDELKELYRLFTDSDATIKNLTITRDEYSISLEGYIEIPEFEEELLKEDPNATIVVDDDYEITDYDVKVYHHSGDCTLDYRKWMYKKFGDEYAREYLFQNYL
ncbi:hypothetical protein DW019_11200 [Clostridium sp. AF37-5]|jgi:hypothetical protein|uniref:hypothetical protein n=1 Tax=Clostridium sp. AF37-5 TaxID=2293016 RepID=UPI000E500B58|nr:hypothetical protein [Clostridium sp. AF37-5]RHO95811.1 hypothetical protein DW019_11200 [Clostridium sp. AF37-5]